MTNKEAAARLESIKERIFRNPEYCDAEKWPDILALNKGITALENQSDELAAARLEARKQIHIAEMRRMNVEIFVLAVLAAAVIAFYF